MSPVAPQATTALAAVKVPPGPRVLKALQGIVFIASRRWTIQQMVRRYGDIFTLNLPVYGHTVVVANPQLAKQVFTTSPDDLGNVKPNLSRLLGPGSVFGLEGDDHRRRRRLLAPPFHGKSINNYQNIVEEETLREIAGWPEGEAFPTLRAAQELEVAHQSLICPPSRETCWRPTHREVIGAGSGRVQALCAPPYPLERLTDLVHSIRGVHRLVPL